MSARRTPRRPAAGLAAVVVLVTGAALAPGSGERFGSRLAQAKKPGQAVAIPFGVAELADRVAELAAPLIEGFRLPAGARVTLTVRGPLGARDLTLVEHAVAARVPGVVADRVGDLAAARAAGVAAAVEVEVALDGEQARVVVRVRRLSGLSLAVLVRRARWLGRAEGAWPVNADARHALGAPAPGRLPGKPRRAEIDLGTPLLAVAVGDVDGDGDGDLIALSEDAVVWLEPQKGDKGLVERARVTLGGPPPVPRPRSRVGALVVADTDGDGRAEIYARTSQHEAGLIARVDAARGLIAAPLGAGERYPLAAVAPTPGAPAVVFGASLEPGTHVFLGATWAVVVGTTVAAAPRAAAAPSTERALAATGARPERFVGAQGAGPAGFVAFVGETGAVTLVGPGERVAGKLGPAGAALALLDVDRDGRLEAATTAYAAAGDADRVVLVAIDADGKTHEAWRGAPSTAGVVAVAAGDLDGDGLDDLVWVARLPGATRATVWITP